MAMRSFMLSTKLSLRRRTVAAATGNSPADVSIPTHFKCPISLDLMKDPVTLATGITYDRHSIETWLEAGNFTCPVTKQPLFAFSGEADLIPNHSIRRMIQDWCVAHSTLGVDRIPTPKTPITALQVSETLSEISAARLSGDRTRFEELVAKIMIWASESERNRRCISSNGAAPVLAAAFRNIPSEQALSAIAGMSPLDEESRRQLASVESLNSIVYILSNGNLSGRLHAALILKEIASADTEEAAVISKAVGLVEAIVRLIKEPISPQATKAALIAAYYLAGSNHLAASRFAEMGMVTVLLEMLVDAERSLCEKGLAMLEAILSSEAGREMAVRHDLTVPVLVKKMLRVSDMATELAVSAIWKLCRKIGKGRKSEEKCLKEAAQFGAFQKLLLLLQVGCSDITKGKASELLRMLNGFRGNVECIESADFKGIKRPF